jgi:hypothetical protein
VEGKSRYYTARPKLVNRFSEAWQHKTHPAQIKQLKQTITHTKQHIRRPAKIGAAT